MMLGLGHGVQTDTVSLVEIFSNNFSISFDGTNDYIDLDSRASIIDGSKGTFSAWVKLDTTSTTGQFVNARVDSNNIIQLFYHAGNNELRATHKGAGTAKGVVTSTAIENTGNFHHVACTWSFSDGNIKLYLDGALEDTTSGLVNTVGTFNKLDIGKSTGGDTAYHDGLIDEVSIFTEVVDIATLYNGGSPKDVEFSALDGLVAYYRFEEGSGTTVNDESGNGNHGTLTNGPTFNTSTP